jgi:putative flippase GtrA
VCGSSTAMLDLVVYFLSYNFLFHKESVPIGSAHIGAHIAAFGVSFLVSFPYGFLMNKYIVFTSSSLKGRVQFFRYTLIVISCIGLNYIFLKLFVEFFHWYATPSKALTTALVAVYSYISQQLFSFKSHKTNTDFIEE